MLTNRLAALSPTVAAAAVAASIAAAALSGPGWTGVCRTS